MRLLGLPNVELNGDKKKRREWVTGSMLTKIWTELSSLMVIELGRQKNHQGTVWYLVFVRMGGCWVIMPHKVQHFMPYFEIGGSLISCSSFFSLFILFCFFVFFDNHEKRGCIVCFDKSLALERKSESRKRNFSLDLENLIVSISLSTLDFREW